MDNRSLRSIHQWERMRKKLVTSKMKTLTAAGMTAFFAMELLALLLRGDSMLMFQPLGAMALLGDFVSSGAYRDKRELKKLGVCADAVAAALLLGAVNSVNAGALLKETWAVIFSTNRLTINNLAGILWIGAVFTCVLVRKRKVVVPFLYLATARTIVWSYLIYKGRLPDRVTRPLLFGETVFLLLFLLRIWEQETSNRSERGNKLYLFRRVVLQQSRCASVG